jgi:O-antigen/teichoic acid export membrane protein
MSLRTQVLRGGTYLVLHQGLEVIIRLAGVLLLTRIIAPEQYGIYAATTAIFLYLQLIKQLGIESLVAVVLLPDTHQKLKNYFKSLRGVKPEGSF